MLAAPLDRASQIFWSTKAKPDTYLTSLNSGTVEATVFTGMAQTTLQSQVV